MEKIADRKRTGFGSLYLLGIGDVIELTKPLTLKESDSTP